MQLGYLIIFDINVLIKALQNTILIAKCICISQCMHQKNLHAGYVQLSKSTSGSQGWIWVYQPVRVSYSSLALFGL